MTVRVVLFLALALAAFPALAQNTPVYQNGGVVNGRGSCWLSNGVVGDCGPAAAGKVTELGITGPGTPFCINDVLTVGGPVQHQFCIGALALGGGLINYQPYNHAAALPFNVTTSGALVMSSQTQQIQAKNLPATVGAVSQLCINPTSGTLSVGTPTGCGTGPLLSFLLAQQGGYILLQNGGRIILQ